MYKASSTVLNTKNTKKKTLQIIILRAAASGSPRATYEHIAKSRAMRSRTQFSLAIRHGNAPIYH